MFLSNVEDITSALTTFLNRANFAITSASPERNTTQIFVDIVEQIEATIRNIDILNDMQKECIIQELRDHIRQSGLVTLGRTLEVLRRSFSGITRIFQFLNGFTRNLDGFTLESFPAECLNRFTELSICGRCRSRIPPLCRNSCGALVRGCFAAFYSGLEKEFDNLWAVLRQLVEMAARGVRELFEAENDLLDINVSSHSEVPIVRKASPLLPFIPPPQPPQLLPSLLTPFSPSSPPLLSPFPPSHPPLPLLPSLLLSLHPSHPPRIIYSSYKW